ncbi:MAG: cell division protein FtsA [Elusimicrobia bacterium]|nr:cell division protein FtsA [Elusimicrobiota bacterium]
MPKEEIIAGLDIGSNKVCCVAGTKDSSSRIVKILAGSTVISNDGIKAGAVINIQEASLAIEKVVDEVEKTIGQNVSGAVLAMRGQFIKALNSKGVASINTANREITEETVHSAIESAKKTVRLDPTQEILQIIPREFILNHQKGIQNPIGMEATFIEVDAQTFVATSSNVSNIVKAMGELECLDKVYGHLAASDAVVTKEEKELGCLAVDLGGLTTGIAHYCEGIIKFSYELPVGFDYITRDIMHRLRAVSGTAREIKETYGAVFYDPLLEPLEFEYTGADGNIREYDRAQLVEVVQHRVDQIIVAIEEVLRKNTPFEEFLSGGIILTGGGARLSKITEAFEKSFNCSCRLGLPDSSKIVGPAEIINNPVYTTAIGAVNTGFLNEYAMPGSRSSSAGAVGKIFGWLKDTF